MDALGQHEIIVGTYEGFVLGLVAAENNSKDVSKDKSKKKSEKKSNLSLCLSFATHAHSSSVRCLASGSKFLVSSGSDEQVRIYNLRNRREHGQLEHHEGVVTAAAFHYPHLLSVSEDRSLRITRAPQWRLEKTLLKHQAQIVSVSVHPSGKLALSLDKDNKLITWNLVKGRAAYVTNLGHGKSGEFVKFDNNEGAKFAVGFGQQIDIYDLASAKVVMSIDLKKRPNGALFLDKNKVIVASDMPELHVYDFEKKELICSFKAHETRVRCLALINNDADKDTDGGKGRFAKALVTASNDGLVKVWRVSEDEDLKFELDAQYDVKGRITCMTAHKVPKIKNSNEINEGVKEVKVVKEGKAKKRVRMMDPSEEEGEQEEGPKVVVEDEGLKTSTNVVEKSSQKIKRKNKKV